MKYEVLWSSFASVQLEDVFEYYSKVSEQTAKKVILEILSNVDKLKFNLELGQIEELLIQRKYNYRYFVIGNYKIIYAVIDARNTVLISDVFDSRQNPEKNSRNK